MQFLAPFVGAVYFYYRKATRSSVARHAVVPSPLHGAHVSHSYSYFNPFPQPTAHYDFVFNGQYKQWSGNGARPAARHSQLPLEYSSVQLKHNNRVVSRQS